MALFVPQWPSAADDEQSNNNNDNSIDTTNDTVTVESESATMNGTRSDDGDGASPTINNTASAYPTLSTNTNTTQEANGGAEDNEGLADDGIELTHDPITGSISVTESIASSTTATTTGDTDNDDMEHADGADDQMKLWSAIRGDINPSVFGDIWSTEAFAFQTANSPLKDLLDSNTYSLVDLLAQEELLQELRGCEERLVEYFGRGEVVAGLVECLMIEIPYEHDDGGKNGRERWCEEERVRRREQRQRQLKVAQKQQQDLATNVQVGTPNEKDKTKTVTLLDASSPKQTNPLHIETIKWSSPEKKTAHEHEYGSEVVSSPPTGAGESSYLPTTNNQNEATFHDSLATLSMDMDTINNNEEMELMEDNDDDEQQLTPEEEYDMRYIRYPYMACEVLCSEVGNILNVLVDGYVDDIIVTDDTIVGAGDDGTNINNNNGGNNPHNNENEAVDDDDGMEEIDIMDETTRASTSKSSVPSPLAPSQIPPPPPPPISSNNMNMPTPKRRILDLLFATLLTTPHSTLDDRRSGYFERLLNILWRKQSQAMSDYMNTPLIVVPESMAMAKEILGRATELLVTMDQQKKEIEHENEAREENKDGSEDGSDKSGAAEPIPIPIRHKFPSPHTPPMLMCALFDHLHSYSIMHIVQRLLLPSPIREVHKKKLLGGGEGAGVGDYLVPLFAAALEQDGTANQEGAAAAGQLTAEEEEEEENIEQSAMNNQFINALNQMNNPNPMPPSGGALPNNGIMGSAMDDEDDDDEEEEEEDDPMNFILQCTWSDQPQYALELLLKRLEGDTSSFLRGYGFPVGYNSTAEDDDADRITSLSSTDGTNNEEEIMANDQQQQQKTRHPDSSQEDEAILSCSQHASEILITIIQNSSLDSPVMLSLSQEPSLRRIIDLIMPTTSSSNNNNKSNNEGEDTDDYAKPSSEFSAHESTMTCAITVLESLVLQLGGYGAVATATLENAEETNGEGGGEETTTPINATMMMMEGSPQKSMDVNNGQLSLPSMSNNSSLTEIGPHTPPPLSKKSSSNVSSTQQPPAIATISTLLCYIPTLLSHLSNLLTHTNTQKWAVPAQYSNSQPRPLLGTSRLRILRLIESLVLLSNPTVDAALLESDILNVCVELFWQFEWCSMLHQSVANLLVHVFEGGEGRAELQTYFLGRCKILERLMNSFEQSDYNNYLATEIDNPAGGVGVSGDMEGTSVEEAKSSDKEDEASTNSPKYGEMMTAMKNMYSDEKCTSSIESEDGSAGEAVNEDDDDVAPVSEDDVDSAMEKECQEGGENIVGITPNEETPVDQQQAKESSDVVTDHSSSPPQQLQDGTAPRSNNTTFRKGYMGHIIIICQALVHACNNTVNPELGVSTSCDEGIPPGMSEDNEEQCSSPLSSTSMDEISTTSSFDSSAVQSPIHGDSDSVCSNNSKKRKDRSPVRDGSQHEDLKRLAAASPNATANCDDLFSPTSPIPTVPSSPLHLDASIAQSPSSDAPDGNGADENSLSIGHILLLHPLHDKWRNFITSVLASEMSVQSTPLGGQQQQLQSETSTAADTINDLQGHIMASLNGNCDDDFLGTDDQGQGSGAIGGLIVGEIDMDENDLDIAASMMEALSLPPSNGGTGGDGPPVRHNRRRGVIVGGAALLGGGDLATAASEKGSAGGIGNFGSVIQQPGGLTDYVYDDPLGGVHPFGNGDSSDEEDNSPGDTKTDTDDDGFMSDAMVVSRDGAVSKQGGSNTNGSIKKSESESSDEIEDYDDDDDDDDEAPVMDLFAGSFEANFANFDAFDSSVPKSHDNPFGGGGKDDTSPGDDLFADSAKTDDDPFEFSKPPFDLVDSLSQDAEA